MPEPLRCVPDDALITGWDFSTGSVKCLAFDLSGTVVAEYRGPTDLWTADGVMELSLLQLEGQARASVRHIAGLLREIGRLGDWVAGGISATHHTAGRIDRFHNQVRRAIAWDDQTLADYQKIGIERLGGKEAATALTGGPWAERYSLSHLVKDEVHLPIEDWVRTQWMLLHGPLAAGYLTGCFGSTSLSSAASTGILDLRTGRWQKDMLNAIANPVLRELAWQQLPALADMNHPIGPVMGVDGCESLVFPTLDDQAAGLVGGGAVADGEAAIILGTSAVVNASSNKLPGTDKLDAMLLNWDAKKLWMRCYSNGDQFLKAIVGDHPDWKQLEQAAEDAGAGAKGAEVLPFVKPERSLGVTKPRFEWITAGKDIGEETRAGFEALAYLIGVAVKAHEKARGSKLLRVALSGGNARSTLLCQILASVLNRPIERLVSEEGPALGAAVTALAGYETYLRRRRGMTGAFGVADAVATLVRYREQVEPRTEWVSTYEQGLKRFEGRITM